MTVQIRYRVPISQALFDKAMADHKNGKGTVNKILVKLCALHEAAEVNGINPDDLIVVEQDLTSTRKWVTFE